MYCSNFRALRVGKLCVTLALLSGATAGAHAGTVAERLALQADPPHSIATSEKSVRAHWVRKVSFVSGEQAARENARSMRAEYNDCVKHLSPGARAKPVEEWPDFDSLSVVDEYLSDAAITRHTRITSYGVASSPEWECMLHEQVTSSASVHSDAGTCRIDLLTRKAHGVCRRQGQFVGHLPESLVRRAASGPGAYGSVGGGFTVAETRYVQGVPCIVVRSQVLGLSHCFAKMGNFRGYYAGAPRPAGALPLSLEDESLTVGVLGYAVQVQADVRVTPATLLPYLAPGVTVKEDAR